MLKGSKPRASTACGQRRFAFSWPGLVAVLGAYVLGAALTWRKWPDVLTDFGSQLYLPWRIAEGSVLYRDVMYLTGGPLSQHYHALLFKIFGVSMLPLFISNLALGFGLLILLYRFFLNCSDIWTATLACLGVTLVFAFNQYSNIGNFNFIAPYCHEIWHGLVLSIVAVALLSTWVVRKQRRFMTLAGFCIGLVFMTKPEVFVALAAAFIVAIVLAAARNGIRSVAKSVFAAAIAGIVGPLAMLLWFHRAEGWCESARSVMFAWVPLLKSSVSHEFFYKWVMGLDAPFYHLRMMVTQFLVLCAVLGVCAAWFRRTIDTPAKRLVTAGLMALLVALASALDWVDCGRSLPILVLGLCVLLWKRADIFQDRKTVETAKSSGSGSALLNDEGGPSLEKSGAQTVFPFLFSIFALFLLAKLGFYSRIWHYGFVLAMPAFCAAVYLLHWLLPSLLERFGVNRRLFRVTVWLLLVVGFLRLFVQSQLVYASKTVPVGSGSDTVLTFGGKMNPAGPGIQTALSWVRTNIPPESTLAVLPEGVMVNYLSRRANPTRYLVWNPAEIASFGQENMTAAFRDHPPDYVMLIHRDASEYGARYFGQEKKFGLDLMQWIGSQYEPVCLIGNEPLQDDLFGIKVLRRRASAETGR
jgi:hypothetical protein